MKTTGKKNIPPPITPQVHHLAQERTLPLHDDGGIDADTMFLQHVAKIAKITPKEIQYSCRVNKTTAYAWWNGTKPHPFKRARDLLSEFPVHLYPTILEYIAGSNFDGDILTGAENAALMVLAKRSKESV